MAKTLSLAPKEQLLYWHDDDTFQEIPWNDFKEKITEIMEQEKFKIEVSNLAESSGITIEEARESVENRHIRMSLEMIMSLLQVSEADFLEFLDYFNSEKVIKRRKEKGSGILNLYRTWEWLAKENIDFAIFLKYLLHNNCRIYSIDNYGIETECDKEMLNKVIMDLELEAE